MRGEDDWIAPEHDPFQGPDAEPEADTRERDLADEEAAGDGEADPIGGDPSVDRGSD
jgi:hypothetical protein